jgi:hypothetical protein
MDPLWVSVGVTVILVLITGYYAYQTRRIAKTSEDAARAAVEQAQELRQQRIHASQPILWPVIQKWNYNQLDVNFENIGNGPALDVDIYLGPGENLVISDCEHQRYSYVVAGEKKTHNFLRQALQDDGMGGTIPPDSSVLSKLMGKYTLLVEWRDLYKSGPFFQAKLPFSLEIDSEGKLYIKEDVVVIDKLPEKRKDR